MTVLVAFSSKHGATEEIARSIGEILDGQGLTVEVRRVEDVDTVLPYSAFVVGSAVYMGRWTRGARKFVDGHAELLARQPTWLFSSGPIGSPSDSPERDSLDVGKLVAATHARDHQLFSGKLDTAELGLGGTGVGRRATRAERGLPAMGRRDGLGDRDRADTHVRSDHPTCAVGSNAEPRTEEAGRCQPPTRSTSKTRKARLADAGGYEIVHQSEGSRDRRLRPRRPGAGPPAAPRRRRGLRRARRRRDARDRRRAGRPTGRARGVRPRRRRAPLHRVRATERAGDLRQARLTCT